MSAKIDMVDISKYMFNLLGRGSIHLTAKAAKSCLKKAGLNPSCLGLVINTGIYRDKNIIEPAIATFIQRKIGAKPLLLRNNRIACNRSDTTFSFDLNNGGCGLVSALELVNGFVQSGEIRRGMVVTGDAEPFRGLSKSFEFTTAAAAIILSAASDGEGFMKFKTSTFPQ